MGGVEEILSGHQIAGETPAPFCDSEPHQPPYSHLSLNKGQVGGTHARWGREAENGCGMPRKCSS